MKIDCHMHTPLCGHAHGDPSAYVRMAAEEEIRLVTFTCHIPMTSPGFGGPRIRMTEAQLPEYFALVDQARQEGARLGVEVLCGIEAEVFPDEAIMAAMDRTLESFGFDFILGSLHHHVPAYQAWIKEHRLISDHEIIMHYFEHLTAGVRSGRYHSMSHPDVIRLYGTVASFEPQSHEPVIRRFLQALVDEDVCMEVNTSGLTKGVYTVHPDPVILKWAAPMGVKLTIGSDAHLPESVGQMFHVVLPLLTSTGFSELHYHRHGQRQPVPLTAVPGQVRS